VYQQWNPNNPNFEPDALPDPSYGNPSTTASGGQNPTPTSGDIPGFTGNYYPSTMAPSGITSAPQMPSDSGGGAPTMTDQQMIDKLGFDPGDPRNDMTSGFGSGRPTQKAIGTIGSFLGNMAFPGLGFLTGAAASKITQMIQNGAGKQAVQNAIKQFQQGGGADVSVGGLDDTTGNAPGGGSKFGGFFGGLPEGFTEGNRFGGGAPTFEGPGFTGPSWSPGGSIFGGTMNPNMNLAGSWSNLGASGGGLAPGMANLYLHSAPMQSWAQNQGYKSIGDFMQQTGFSLAGGNPSGANLSGAGRPMTSSR
jgi:hypothetical protein